MSTSIYPPSRRAVDPVTGETILIGDERLRGTGVFGDPNDVCSCVTNIGIMLSLYATLSARAILSRLFRLAP